MANPAPPRVASLGLRTHTSPCWMRIVSPGRPTNRLMKLVRASVLMAGGTYNGLGLSTGDASIYDPATRKMHNVKPMSIGRIGHTATLLRDGRVLPQLVDHLGNGHPVRLAGTPAPVKLAGRAPISPRGGRREGVIHLFGYWMRQPAQRGRPHARRLRS